MLRRVKYFQSVVSLGSFTKAAEEHNISQSAISQQIQALEQELGFQLLVREKRKFSLTPAGEHFYSKSISIVEEMDKLCRQSARIARHGLAELRIGYLRGYVGHELQLAVAEFSRKWPEVTVEIAGGNHEELYELLRMEKVDLVLSDQRRAFSDVYENLHLVYSDCFVEVSIYSNLAEHNEVSVEDLRSYSCILVAPPSQQHIEENYYKKILGFGGKFLFAQTLDEARLMVTGGKGFMPIEGSDAPTQFGATIRRIPVTRSGEPIKRNYCAFWRKDNSGYYIEEFAEILHRQFPEE